MKETDDVEQAKLDDKIEQQQSEMKDDNTESSNLSLKEMVDCMLNENEKLRSVDTEKFYSILEEVMMEQYGDIDSINESTDKTITAKFFDRGNINIVISNGVSHADMFPDNVNDLISSVIKTCCTNKALYDYLYTRNKSFFEDINEEPYLGGKTINCGKDLINAIETKYKFYCGAAMEKSKDGKEVPVIFFNGEYWCEPEHGFSISFPNGKIVKSAEDDVTKSTFICGGAGDYIL
jgi:hypothetical protein